MRTTYRVLAHGIALGVVLQAGWIALAFFGVLHDLDGGSAPEGDNLGQRLHAWFGSGLLPLLALALVAVSFRARVPGGVRRAVVVLAVVAVQIALAELAGRWAPLGVLHGLGAFAVIAAAELAARQAVAPSGAAAPLHTAGRTS